MKFVYNDGGRAEAGYIGDTRDCVCRAIAIAAQRPYKEVYDLINKYAKNERITKRNPKRSNARTGCRKETAQKILKHYGFTWVATMHIGQGCTVHLRESELPKGRIVCNLSGHFAAVIDGVLHDTYDCTRDGSRILFCDTWQNPCGHIDKYADVRAEAAANGLNGDVMSGGG